ncbi:flagellar hook-length control protein FliK [Roseburia sp. AM23-20]|uniref:flagellar hook-length control protein FliK n=1 Tax=Roseburia sp. AM23-20 TaxID=2292066 RepID=UPI000E4E8B36|nr:flagellar hook-length control protein FliK [Roseburia sp. AM23-20]RHF97776.1 flagellar hook-length control protein FliK [Roseburia sp. AM23-20]
MGSTSVSEVTGIMSVGQGSQTLTGTKEGDLKVQFAEVMSQMTTQVGYGYSYGGQNGKQNMSVVTGKSSVTDNYERYQNNAASIKNNPSDKTDIQTGNTDEKLAAFEEDVRQVLKEKLGVTDEEITDAMQKLGLTVADLIQPNQLTQLTAELTGSENIGELLCNDSFMEIVNEIGGLSQDLLDDLGMTSQMFTETVAAASQVVMTPESAGIEQLPEMQVTENVNADKTAANDNQMNSVLEEEKTVQTASDADEVEIQKPEDNILLQKEVAEETDNTDDMQEKTTLSEDNSLMQEETDTKADDGQTGNRNESGNTSNQTAFVSQEHTVDPAAAKTPETVPEFSRQLDTLDLIRQVTEFTKITVREAQTTMEMQLNPEHLGKIYIEVTTKEGNVSAHIMTQNELVKEALEAQMAELKQSMNQAGVKVDAVEVTVGSHEFEKNLEQNAKQEERQAEEQEKASPKTRRINLDDLDELSGVMSEEEALVAQIMADHGNSVDYTA